MNIPNFKFYLIAIIFLIIVTVIISLSLISKPKTNKITSVQPTTSLPLPTSILDLIPTKIASSPIAFLSSTPAPTIEATRTGALIEKIPQEVLDSTAEQRELRKKTPLKENGFVVEFDFANDIFIVKLDEPKEDNKNRFSDWLKTNYPSTPQNRFSYQ